MQESVVCRQHLKPRELDEVFKGLSVAGEEEEEQGLRPVALQLQEVGEER